MRNSSFPAVSVILPILNEERDLANCISAILQQDYPSDIEIILALGPSKDKTNQIANQLVAADNRIKLVNNLTGQTAVGLNLAIAAATYEIICRVDGHSEISNSYIKTAVEIMQQIKKFEKEWANYDKAVKLVESNFAKLTESIEEIGTGGKRFKKLSVPVRDIDNLRKKQGIPELEAAGDDIIDVEEDE